MKVGHRATRRRFIAAVTGSAMVALVTGTRASAAPGTIVAISLPRTITLRLADGTPRNVQFAPGARFVREGPAALASFAVGDPVVVALDGLPAAALDVFYRRADGIVTGITRTNLETSAGRFLIDSHTLFYRGDRTHLVGLTSLRPGAAVEIMHRADGRANGQIAVHVNGQVEVPTCGQLEVPTHDVADPCAGVGS